VNLGRIVTAALLAIALRLLARLRGLSSRGPGSTSLGAAFSQPKRPEPKRQQRKCARLWNPGRSVWRERVGEPEAAGRIGGAGTICRITVVARRIVAPDPAAPTGRMRRWARSSRRRQRSRMVLASMTVTRGRDRNVAGSAITLPGLADRGTATMPSRGVRWVQAIKPVMLKA